MSQSLLDKIAAFSSAYDAGEDCSSLREELKGLGVGFNPDDENIDLDYSTEEVKRQIVHGLRGGWSRK
jgi:hypothetical protein